MAEEDRFERISSLTLASGLHVFRYVSFNGAGVPAVARMMASGSDVAMLDMPGRDGGVLRQPGDCLVLRAERPCEVRVGLNRGARESSLDASFRLEPLALAPAVATPRPSAAAPVSFVAHLANIGDAAFTQGVWAGGPDRPAIVEGLQIVAEAGAAPLEMQVLAGSRPPRWSEWVGPGQFAGTRGHNLPLIGVRLRLKPEAAGVEIVAEALFLGALVAAQRGRQIEFVSASGVDPLVGLKIAVLPARDSVVSIDAPNRDSRVRVFRASAGR